VGLFAIPVLIRGLGTERFGVLTLAWVIVGYFGVLDLGLGRALTKLVAERLGANQEREVPGLFWTALVIISVLGVLGGILLGVLSPWLVRKALKVPASLQSETRQAFYLLAVSVPVVIGTTGLRGLLEAYQRFGLSSSVRILLGVFTFLAPVLVLPFSRSLIAVVAVLLLGRVLGSILYVLFCLQVVPALRHGIRLRKDFISPLLRFGGWMTVSNLVGPLMVYLDRFLVAAFISMAAVTYYATPYEVVTKLWLIPGALVGVLFPAFSSTVARDRTRAVFLFLRGFKYILLAVFPLCLVIVTLAREGLTLWLGPEFAHQSTRVMQWLTIGVFLNSLAQVSFACIQGTGRPDLTARVHLLELPIYLAALWGALGARGIEGAAMVWTARVGIDAVVLFAFAGKLLSLGAAEFRHMATATAAALGILLVAMLPGSVHVKGLFLCVMFLALIPLTWFTLLSHEEQELVRKGRGIFR
jgi:O-antigen/teichoic acid export membrane protein